MIETNTGAKKIEGSDGWREIFDVHNESVEAHDAAICQTCQTITGTRNNSGHTINSGEYFIANGGKYKATASIPNGEPWASSAEPVTDNDLIGALNGKLTKNPVYDSIFTEATAAQLNASGSRTIETKTFPSGDSVYLVIVFFDASAILGGIRANVSIGNGTNSVTAYEGTPSTSNFFGGSGSFLAKGGDTVSCTLYTNDVNSLSSFRCGMCFVQLR